MRPRRKLRLGIIGTGAFVRACHIPGLQSHPRAEIVAICGSHFDRARALADQFNIRYVYTSPDELCERDDIDAVTIATPNLFHMPQALVAFKQRKHVLCEKPLAVNLDAAAKMTQAAHDSGKVHQVAFTFRYGYAVRELRRRVQLGDIGKPFYLRIQYDNWTGLQPDWRIGWRENQQLAGGGILYDLGAHLFDIVQFACGPLETVCGFRINVPRMRTHSYTKLTASVETDDLAAVWFRHRTGVHGHWFVSRVTPKQTENGWLEVIGPEGALKASLSRGAVDVLKVATPSSESWELVPLPTEASDHTPHNLGLMMRSFVDACLRGHLDKNVDACFEDGFAVQKAIEAVAEAHEGSRWVGMDQAPRRESSSPELSTTA